MGLNFTGEYTPEQQALIDQEAIRQGIDPEATRAAGTRGPVEIAKGALGPTFPPATPAQVSALPENVANVGNNPYSDLDGEMEEGGGASTEGTDAKRAEVLASIAAQDEIFRSGGRGGQSATVLPEGENFNPLGGKEGRKNFNTAYDPDPLINAMMNAEDAKAARNEAVTSHYKSEAERQTAAMAGINARRAADQQEEQRRMAVLDQQVTRYTDDLHNQNKFFENPGNIISAIAFSLMPIFSSDPAIGAKLIGQAIDRDMASRKSTADMHLGELRSNLGAYRKMMGDKQAGDLMAEAETRRIAAMEIERIGAQFESPISKAKTMAAAEMQRSQAAALRMEAYRHGAYVGPRVERPGIVGALKAGGGYTPYGVEQGTPGSGARSIVANSPSTAVGADEKPSSLSAARTMALAVGKPEEALRQAKAGNLTTSDVHAIVNQGIAARIASYKVPGTPAYNEEFQKMRKDANEGASAIAKQAQPFQARQAALSSIQQDMNYIENFYRNKKYGNRNPNAFMDDLRTGVGSGTAEWLRDLQQRYSDPKSPEAVEVKAAVRASNRLYQKLAGELVGFKSKAIGGSQSVQELAGVGEYITNNPSWEKFSGYVRNESMKAQRELMNAIDSSTSSEGKLIWLAEHGGTRLPGLDSPGISSRKK